jgi:hypothetical protein
MEVNCNSAAQVGVRNIFFDSWGHDNGAGVSVLGVVESSGSQWNVSSATMDT